MAAQLYRMPDEGADALAAYTNEQLEILIAFLRGNVAYQEERMRRLEALIGARGERGASGPSW
jgi:hypothetical protein